MIYFRHYEVLGNTALCKIYRDQCNTGSHRGAVLSGTRLFTTKIIKIITHRSSSICSVQLLKFNPIIRVINRMTCPDSAIETTLI